MSLKWRMKEHCQKNKRQRWDICNEFSVWHFVTKSTGLKSVKPGTSSHFFESRDPSYVSSAMHPECPRKEWRTKSFKLQSNFHWRLVYLVYDGFLYCFCLLAESYEIIKHYHSTPTEKWPRVRPRTRWCVTTSPTLLGPVLVWSEQNYLKLLLIVRNFVST